MTDAGKVYGEALYQLAREEDLDETIFQQMGVLEQSFRQEQDFPLILGMMPMLCLKQKEATALTGITACSSG